VQRLVEARVEEAQVDLLAAEQQLLRERMPRIDALASTTR
jgi:hypothetical protein